MLRPEQVDQIEAQLVKTGMDHIQIRAEVLDHLCCQIEEKMALGNSFEMASEQSWETFGEEGPQQVQTATINLLTYHNQSKRMKQLMFMGGLCAVISLLFLMNALGQGLPDFHPLSSDVAVTSAFGQRVHPETKKKRHHMGVDFKVAEGTPIYAAGDGVVQKAGEGGNYGILVKIEHAEAYESRYAHLSRVAVSVGQEVKKGDLIAYSGNTGLSKKPHLHFEVRKDGKAVNPEKIWQE